MSTYHDLYEKLEPSGRERKEMMLKFLEANVCITRAEYSRLTNVTDRRASCDLQEYLTEGIIRKRAKDAAAVSLLSLRHL